MAVEPWRDTLAKQAAKLEQSKWVTLAATLRAENERARADAAEQALVNYIALAEFAVPVPRREPEPEQMRAPRKVDLWPVRRRPAPEGVPQVPRPRRGTRRS
jgi:hypothetical protein